MRDPLGIRPLCLAQPRRRLLLRLRDLRLRPPRRQVHPRHRAGRDRRARRARACTATSTTEREQQAFCVFEYIYFARPDSYLRGERVYPVRMAARARSLRRSTRPRPTSSSACRTPRPRRPIGYARESGIPFAEALVKNRYVGRTFIMPDQRIRDQGVHLKFNPLREVLEGQRVVVVDDSIVRVDDDPSGRRDAARGRRRARSTCA